MVVDFFALTVSALILIYINFEICCGLLHSFIYINMQIYYRLLHLFIYINNQICKNVKMGFSTNTYTKFGQVFHSGRRFILSLSEFFGGSALLKKLSSHCGKLVEFGLLVCFYPSFPTTGEGRKVEGWVGGEEEVSELILTSVWGYNRFKGLNDFLFDYFGFGSLDLLYSETRENFQGGV